MNNILYYTISNLSQDSILCIRLLLKSLYNKIPNLNFKILVYDKDFLNCDIYDDLIDYILVVDSSIYLNQHLFNLKFTKSIFELPYEYFCYLDSDMIYYLNNYSFSPQINYFCYEKTLLTNKFFSMYWPKDITLNTEKRRGINAGFFAINKNTSLELNSFMNEYLYNNTGKKWWIEQNMFNLFVYQQIINNKNIWLDYSKNVLLFANENTTLIDNKIYHFCGNAMKMNIKYNKMYNFLIKNKIVL